MILYYAQGGGLGHLTRGRAVWQTLELPLEQILLLSNSIFAKNPFIPPEVEVVYPPESFAFQREKYSSWLKDLLYQYEISAVYLDSFPMGIVGEWQDLYFLSQKIPFYYIARLLRWEYYLGLYHERTPTFFKTYVLETLEPSHQLFIEENSWSISSLILEYPTYIAGKPLDLPAFWLILHSEPLEEVKFLWEYAQEQAKIEEKKPFWVICTQSPKADWFEEEQGIWVNAFPATHYLAEAERIFSAAGFNTLQQTANYKNKHRVLPFFRKYDEQFIRAKHYSLNNLTL